jgi:uncharacterized membrane protein
MIDPNYRLVFFFLVFLFCIIVIVYLYNNYKKGKSDHPYFIYTYLMIGVCALLFVIVLILRKNIWVLLVFECLCVIAAGIFLTIGTIKDRRRKKSSSTE